MCRSSGLLPSSRGRIYGENNRLGTKARCAVSETAIEFVRGAPLAGMSFSCTRGTYCEQAAGHEPIRALGNSKPNVGSAKFGEESVFSDGEYYVRQPESPNATEASRISGKLKLQCAPLLVCELGSPGGLCLDSKMIRIDTEGDSLRKAHPSTVASVVGQAKLSIEIYSPCRPDKSQIIHTDLYPRSDGLETFEFRKPAIMKGLAEEESQVANKICHSHDLFVLGSFQPAIFASNERSAMPQHASGLVAEDDRQQCLDAPGRDFPSTCTSSLSRCSGPVGEAELEINIPIEEEELEICLPIEEEELEICLPIEEEELEICLPIEEEELEIRLPIEEDEDD